MKKILLLFLLVPMISFSQNEVDTLMVTPYNVNGYLVKQFEGKTPTDIYNSFKKWLQYNIKNPDFSLTNDVENEYLSFNVSGVGDIRYKNSDNWQWKLYLNTEIRIKDDRVRIDISIIEIRGVNGVDNIPINPQGGLSGMNALFDKKGRERKATKTYRDDINVALNSFANELFSAVGGNVDYKKDDW